MKSGATIDQQGSSLSERGPDFNNPGASTYPPGYIPRTSHQNLNAPLRDASPSVKNENEKVADYISTTEAASDDSSESPVFSDFHEPEASGTKHSVVTNKDNEEQVTESGDQNNDETTVEVDAVGLTDDETGEHNSISMNQLMNEPGEVDVVKPDSASTAVEMALSVDDQVSASEETSAAPGGSDEAYGEETRIEGETLESGPGTDSTSATGLLNEDMPGYTAEFNEVVLQDADSRGMTKETNHTYGMDPDEPAMLQDSALDASSHNRINIETTEAEHQPDSDVTAESDQVAVSAAQENMATIPLDSDSIDEMWQAEEITESSEPTRIELELQPDGEYAADTGFTLSESPKTDIDILANGITFTSLMSIAIILLTRLRRSNRSRRCCCCSTFFHARAPTKLTSIGASEGTPNSSFLKSIRTVCHGVHEELSALRNHQTRTEVEYLKSSNQILASFNSQVAVATPPTARRTRIPSLNEFQ